MNISMTTDSNIKDNIFWWFKTHAFEMEHLFTSIIIASNEGCIIGKNDDVLRTTITCPFKRIVPTILV